jgi:hypothetical protein
MMSRYPIYRRRITLGGTIQTDVREPASELILHSLAVAGKSDHLGHLVQGNLK